MRVQSDRKCIFLFTDTAPINRTRLSLTGIDTRKMRSDTLRAVQVPIRLRVCCHSLYECILSEIDVSDNIIYIRFIGVMSVNGKTL